MGKWLERARALEAEHNRHNRDTSSETAAIVPIVPNVPGSLPPAIVRGLDRLRTMAAPRMARPEIWPDIVRDCLALATDGWTAKAINLGWPALSLYGVSPAAGGIADLEGLGVWLNGRRILLLDADSCVVANGRNSHAVFHRRSPDGAVLIWDIGGGRGR